MQFYTNSSLSPSASNETVYNSGSTGSSVTYGLGSAYTSAETYNVLARNPSSQGDFSTDIHTTGSLEQGDLYITPTLVNSGGSGVDDDTVTFTIQFKGSTGGWGQAVDTNSVEVRNVTLQVAANSSVDSKHVFGAVGEYRVLTTDITGGMCSLSQNNTSMRVNFGDENYSSCFASPA